MRLQPIAFDASKIVLTIKIHVGPGCWVRRRITGFVSGQSICIEPTAVLIKGEVTI